LDGANFTVAHLAGASFNEAHLTRADFRWALNLTVGQFANSVGVEKAYFDEAFRREQESAKIVPTEPSAGNDDTPQDTHPTEE
jgi:Pentapeptide repeats (8 copies)